METRILKKEWKNKIGNSEYNNHLKEFYFKDKEVKWGITEE